MNEKDLTLRDRFALEIINGLVAGLGSSSYFDDYLENDEGAIREVEVLAITAYKIADQMRKARLVVFK